MTDTKTATAADVRPLKPEDLDGVVELDRQATGRARRGFYEKRLAAALERPDGYFALGVDRGGHLAGFLIAKLLEGEFGVTAPAAALDTLGVGEAHRGAGLGRALMARLEDILAKKGVEQVYTEAPWTNRPLVDFFAAAGFELAQRHILDRDTASPIEF